MNKRPTMRDVAAAAGVSLMTVSRVVNGEAGVLPETAARVERAIRRLGYQRNDMARQLRRQGQLTQTIGLLVDDLANPFFAALTRAVEDAARLHDCVVLIGSSNDSLAREKEVVSAFCARRVDGLIVVPVAGSHRFLKEQQDRGVKVVCVDRPADNLDADTVLVDNRRGAYQASVPGDSCVPEMADNLVSCVPPARMQLAEVACHVGDVPAGGVTPRA